MAFESRKERIIFEWQGKHIKISSFCSFYDVPDFRKWEKMTRQTRKTTVPFVFTSDKHYLSKVLAKEKV